ncbi:hypothetical protein VSR74_17505 [Pseudocitrobacter sp. Cyp-38S]|uniref:Uncharacterized protein n=1 Tax=Pseudocitrobacter cyperus TaxID=3112843 RepID=A0ABV0HMD6_9ENTR
MKGNSKYIITTLFMSFIVLPLITTLAVFILTSIVQQFEITIFSLIITIIIGSALPFALGYGWRRILKPAENETLRYAILSLPLFYYSLVWVIVATFSYMNLVDPLIKIHYYLIFIYSGYQWVSFYHGILYGGTAMALATQLLFVVGYYLAERRKYPAVHLATAQRNIFLPAAGCLLLAIALMVVRPAKIAAPIAERSDSEQILTAAWKEKPDLKIERNWPRLDGEEGSWPLYAAAFYRLYRGVHDESDYLNCHAEWALEELLMGTSDLLISDVEPAWAQARARKRGFELKITPVAQMKESTQPSQPGRTLYLVTWENPTPETQKLVAWFLSPQGQQLVQDVGYVPMQKALP